jgi:hypothetical protein
MELPGYYTIIDLQDQHTSILLCTTKELGLLVYCLVKLTKHKLQHLIHLLNEFFPQLQVTQVLLQVLKVCALAK